MFQTMREIIDIYKPRKPEMFHNRETYFFSTLQENISYLKSVFGSSADLTVREIRLSGTDAAVISIDNMVDKQVLAEGIMSPLYSFDFTGTPDTCYRNIKYRLLYTADQSDIDTFEQLEARIMSGFAVIAVDGCRKMIACGIQGYASRSVSEPESDVVQKGAREGFVESLRVNMSMVRRRMKNPKLMFEVMTLGEISRTEISICYLRDVVSEQILKKLRERLRSTSLKTVMTAGYLVPYLEDRNDFSFFSGIGTTERPDTLCGKLAEGRIAVMVDGSPSVLIVPYILAEHFQTLDDYSNRAFFATFTRLLKYCAFFTSILLPGIYVSLGTFSPEMFPSLMLNKIAGSIASTPLSLMAETLLILFVYEIMREAGLRMPRPLGYAVSIVGGLVVGDTAINAGLLGAPTLMVVAAASICSYIIPDLYAPSAVLRLLFTITGGLFGIWGTAILFCVVMVNLCGKDTFGIPYTSPVTPFGPSAFRDVIVRAGWKVLSRKTERIQNMPGSDVKECTGVRTSELSEQVSKLEESGYGE